MQGGSSTPFSSSSSGQRTSDTNLPPSQRMGSARARLLTQTYGKGASPSFRPMSTPPSFLKQRNDQSHNTSMTQQQQQNQSRSNSSLAKLQAATNIKIAGYVNPLAPSSSAATGEAATSSSSSNNNNNNQSAESLILQQQQQQAEQELANAKNAADIAEARHRQEVDQAAVATAFEKAQSHLVKLWNDGNVPDEERNEFASRYWNQQQQQQGGGGGGGINLISATSKTLEEIEKMLQIRDSEVRVEKAIEIRQGFLYLLQELSDRFNTGRAERDAARKELLAILPSLRKSTCDVVESVEAWSTLQQQQQQQQSKKNHPKSSSSDSHIPQYFWRGTNYCEKMLNDLSFLGSSRLRLLTDFEPTHNPLLRGPKMFVGVARRDAGMLNERILKATSFLQGIAESATFASSSSPSATSAGGGSPTKNPNMISSSRFSDLQHQQEMLTNNNNNNSSSSSSRLVYDSKQQQQQQQVHKDTTSFGISPQKEQQQQGAKTAGAAGGTNLQQQQTHDIVHTFGMAASRIQALFRGFECRCFYQRLKRQHAAARVLQRAISQYAAKCVTQRLRERKYAAVKIQSLHRGNAVRDRLKYSVKRHRAATDIQRVFRGHITRKRVRAVEFIVKRAINIQKVFRGHRVRRSFEAIVHHRTDFAATKIQALFRGYHVRCQPRFNRHILPVIIKLQSFFRGRLQIIRFRKLQKRNHATIKIQAWARGVAVRSRLHDLRLQVNAASYEKMKRNEWRACVSIQRYFRGYRARSLYPPSSWKGIKNRAQEEEEKSLIQRALMEESRRFKREHLAALKIQTTFRGFHNRKHYTLLKQMTQLVIKIQALVRGFLVRKHKPVLAPEPYDFSVSDMLHDYYYQTQNKEEEGEGEQEEEEHQVGIDPETGEAIMGRNRTNTELDFSALEEGEQQAEADDDDDDEHQQEEQVVQVSKLPFEIEEQLLEDQTNDFTLICSQEQIQFQQLENAFIFSIRHLEEEQQQETRNVEEEEEERKKQKEQELQERQQEVQRQKQQKQEQEEQQKQRRRQEEEEEHLRRQQEEEHLLQRDQREQVELIILNSRHELESEEKGSFEFLLEIEQNERRVANDRFQKRLDHENILRRQQQAMTSHFDTLFFELMRLESRKREVIDIDEEEFSFKKRILVAHRVALDDMERETEKQRQRLAFEEAEKEINALKSRLAREEEEHHQQQQENQRRRRKNKEQQEQEQQEKEKEKEKERERENLLVMKKRSAAAVKIQSQARRLFANSYVDQLQSLKQEKILLLEQQQQEQEEEYLAQLELEEKEEEEEEEKRARQQKQEEKETHEKEEKTIEIVSPTKYWEELSSPERLEQELEQELLLLGKIRREEDEDNREAKMLLQLRQEEKQLSECFEMIRFEEISRKSLLEDELVCLDALIMTELRQDHQSAQLKEVIGFEESSRNLVLEHELVSLDTLIAKLRQSYQETLQKQHDDDDQEQQEQEKIEGKEEEEKEGEKEEKEEEEEEPELVEANEEQERNFVQIEEMTTRASLIGVSYKVQDDISICLSFQAEEKRIIEHSQKEQQERLKKTESCFTTPTSATSAAAVATGVNEKQEQKVKLVAIPAKSLAQAFLGKLFVEAKSEATRRCDAALTIQRVWRGNEARFMAGPTRGWMSRKLEKYNRDRILRERNDMFLESMSMIQCVGRGFLERSNCGNIRASLLGEKARQVRDKLKKERAALTMQCAWRSSEARWQLGQHRERRAEELRLLAEEKVRKEEEEAEAVRAFKESEIQRIAATKIQSQVRRGNAVTEVGWRKERQQFESNKKSQQQQQQQQHKQHQQEQFEKEKEKSEQEDSNLEPETKLADEDVDEL